MSQDHGNADRSIWDHEQVQDDEASTDELRGIKLALTCVVLVIVVAAGGWLLWRTGLAQDYWQQTRNLLEGGGDFNSVMSSARELLAAGDERAAVIQLKNALQQDPGSREARLLLGSIYLGNEQFASAEKELLRARALDARRGLVDAHLVSALLGQRQYERLLEQVQISADAPPAVQAAVMVGRGRALIALGRRDEAATAFAQALMIDSSAVEAHVGYALIAISDGNLPRALIELQRTLAVLPDHRDALVLKADVLAAIGQVDESRSLYRDAARAAPANAEVRLKLASSYLAAGEFSQAGDAIEEARKLAPGDARARYLLALLAYQQGELREAHAQVTDVLGSAPDYPAANLLAGSLAYARGDFATARSHLLVVVREVPSSAAGRKLLAAAELKLGNVAEAAALLDALAPGTTNDRGALGLLAEIHIVKKDFASAGRYLERAVRAAPEDPQLKTKLASIRLQLGETERALAELESIAAVEMDFIQADVALILAHLDAKDYDRALEAIDKLDEKLFGNPMIHSLRGLSYLGMQDAPRARASFEQALRLDPTYFPAASNLALLDMQAGEPQSARARFETILASDNDNQQAQLAMAQIAFGDRDEGEFLSWLERAAATEPVAIQPHVLLSRYHLARGETSRALLLARKVASAHPENPLALDALAVAQFAAKHYANALATCRQLVELSPRSHLYQFRLANTLVAMGQTGPARTALQRSLALKTDSVAALTALTALEIRTGHHQAAQQLAERTQALFPQAPTGFVLEGDNWAARKAYDAAAQSYLQAWQRAQSGLLVVKLHGALEQIGAAADGDVYIQQWLQRNPADARVRRYFAESLMGRQQHGASIAQYEMLLQQAPESVTALNNLAWALFQGGSAGALTYAEKAYQLAPDNAAVLDTLGWILAQRGHYRRATELLWRAVDKAPGAGSIRYHLAWSLRESGDPGSATLMLQELLASGVDFPEKAEASRLLQQL